MRVSRYARARVSSSGHAHSCFCLFQKLLEDEFVTVMIRETEAKFLQSISSDPTLNVTEHYQKIETDSYYGNLARQSLESKGYVKGYYLKGNGSKKGRRFAETQTILKEIRKTMRPRFAWKPYVLRAYFDTQLLIAESRGKVARDFRVFFMGHKGSIEAKYTTNKGVLPKALIDEMRDAFKRSEEFLDRDKVAEDPIEQKRDEMKTKLDTMTQDELAQMQKLLEEMTTAKPVQTESVNC